LNSQLNDVARQQAFHRGWRMAMELVQGECEEAGEPIPDCVIEALQPCEHVSLTGGICDWCSERVELT
jgi:hypothetical protein